MRSLTAKTFALSATLALTLNMAAPAMAFIDTTGHWAEQAINNLSQQGVITGYTTGEFKPQGVVNRAEFATILTKLLNWQTPATSTSANFVDVKPGFWGYNAIQSVSNAGLINGFPGGYFYPSQLINRVEASAILVKAANITLPNTTETNRILSAFSDSNQVPVWARPSVAAAVQSGIFSNIPGTTPFLNPTQPITRAEVATLGQNFNQTIAKLGNGTSNLANNTGNTNGTTTLKARVSMVPANTIFGGYITQPISSETNQVGDTVVITLDRPLTTTEGAIVIPQNSTAIGKITAIEPVGRLEKNGSVTITFNKIKTTDGRTFNISAVVNTEKGKIAGGTKAGRIGRIAGRTGAGAVAGGAAGAILGAIKGQGKADNYALQGAILGAVGGAGSTLLTKGNPVSLEAGEGIELKLTKPLSISTPVNQ